MYCSNCGTELQPNQAVCAKCGTRVPFTRAQPAAAVAAMARPADVPYADFWVRLGAFVIDSILLTIIWLLVPVVVRMAGLPVWLGLLPVLVYFLYYALFESSNSQATLGKMALGIKVTDLQGERIGFGRALGRSMAHIISNFMFFIGYLVGAFTAKRQTLHDMVAGTLVVRKRFEPEEVANAGPAPSSGSMLVVGIVIAAFAGIFIIGILAAIAIPAYQDYTIRAQVIEGLNAANPYKLAVARAYAAGTELPSMSTQTLQLSPPANLQYVASIEVISGAIEIKYGHRANRLIADKSLVLIPASTRDQTVVWICGHAPTPVGTTPSIENGAQYTSLAEKYLPRNCRGM
jgi:uncharacterized RDD family membrane protein YckC/Tfp pilus assembly major pilin PilA